MKSSPLGEYASYEDLGRLEYGRILWANPASRERLLRHWSSPSHPHHERFAEHRALVEQVLAPGKDDESLDADLRPKDTACVQWCGRFRRFSATFRFPLGKMADRR